MFSLNKFNIQESLRFDVSVEDSVLVHMIDRFEHLIHQELDSVLW